MSRSLSPTPTTHNRLLVCVSPSPLSERLLQAGRQLAESTGAEWHALYVETSAHRHLSAEALLRVMHTCIARKQWDVAEAQYLLTFAGLLGVGLVIGRTGAARREGPPGRTAASDRATANGPAELRLARPADPPRHHYGCPQ